MTTMFLQDVQCASCGHRARAPAVRSTQQSGSPDLDLRPPEMQRSTMEYWLQECAACRYVAPDLRHPPSARSREYLGSAAYRAIFDDPDYPGLARRFLAYARLMDAQDIATGGLARLHAAWVCDDAGLDRQAAQCRMDAARVLLRRKPFDDSEDGVTQGAVVVDVLRRARQFEQAETERVALLALRSAAGAVREVLEFQGALIPQADARGYTVADAVSKPADA